MSDRRKHCLALCEFEHIFQRANRPNVVVAVSTRRFLPKLGARREWRASFARSSSNRGLRACHFTRFPDSVEGGIYRMG
jgi:hypothetical protein